MFKVGDIVFLKHCEGPAMSVVEVRGDEVRTMWFDANMNSDSNTFPAVCLEEGEDIEE